MSAGEHEELEPEGFEGDGHEEDDRGGEESLSQHPEAKRARKRRQSARAGKRASSSSSSKKETGGGRRRRELDVRVRLGEAISELAAALERRDPELSDVLRRDGPKMADLLGRWAEHPKSPPFVPAAVAVLAEILEPLRAFGGTVRVLLRRARDRQLARQAAEEYPAEPEPEPVVQTGNGLEPPLPGEERGTPERFRA